MKKTYILQPAPHPARKNALQGVQEAPDGFVITIAEPTRTGSENRLLHALISQVAKKKPWAGKTRDVETWKRLLVAAWCRVEGEAMEILPALDGHGVDIVPRRTSKLSKKECADLIEFIYAWGANVAGIEWDAVE